MHICMLACVRYVYSYVAGACTCMPSLLVRALYNNTVRDMPQASMSLATYDLTTEASLSLSPQGQGHNDIHSDRRRIFKMYVRSYKNII